MTTITIMVEIPIEVEYTAHKAEGDNWNSPMVPAHIDIDDFSIPFPNSLEKYIKEHHLDWIEAECWDNTFAEKEEREIERGER